MRLFLGERLFGTLALGDVEHGAVQPKNVAFRIEYSAASLGDPIKRDRDVLAWSAGAMALGRVIVLFHDRPPQGRGVAEVMDAGLGLYDDFLPLPHARRRLDLDDRQRVSIFADRFAPLQCAAMDEGSWVVLRSNRISSTHGARRLTSGGEAVVLS